MMAMVKMFLLLLVVFEAAALGNSNAIDPSHDLYPYSRSLAPSSPDVDQEKQSKNLCAAECKLSCIGKPVFQKAVCLNNCLVKCAKGSFDSLYEINCTMDCAQASKTSFRYDVNMMDDLVTSCYQRCKRD